MSEQWEAKIQAMESRRGRNHPLAQFRSWLDAYLPEWRSLSYIQIAGTNGKGSTASWLKTMLESKKKVGVFTSPHLVSHFERISCAGRSIPAQDWERIYDRYLFLFEEEEMTMFEIDLFMAIAWFLEQKPDWCVMEVGMGGERDATTALDYTVQAITNIGLDHMAFLGSRKEEIAQAKAGIMKPGISCFTTETDPACWQVLEDHAKDVKAHLISIPPWKGEWIPSLPDYQKNNFALALALYKALGFEMEETSVEQIQERFFWPGRFMAISQDPLIVVDGAHNLHGVEALTKSIFQGEFEQVFFSVLKDKQAEEMISLLQQKVETVILVKFDSYRLADLDALSLQTGLEEMDFSQCLERLQTTQKKTLVCGSLYFIGELLAHWPAAQDTGENGKECGETRGVG